MITSHDKELGEVLCSKLVAYTPLRNPAFKAKIKDEEEPVTHWSKVTDLIYLGDFEASYDTRFFNRCKIRSVVNCTKDLPNSLTGVTYHRVPVNDSLKSTDFREMLSYLDGAVAFIQKRVSRGEPVYVHCAAGRQRSASVVIAWMLRHGGHRNLTEAILSLNRKRPEIFHFLQSINFDSTLIAYSRTLGSKTITL